MLAAGGQEVPGRAECRDRVGRRVVLEVAAGQGGDQTLLVDVDRAARAQQVERQAVPDQQARQRHDERGHAERGEEEPVEGAHGHAHRHRHDHREPLRHPVVHVQHGERGPRQAADGADRQIDLPDQQHEDDADGDQTGPDDVHAEVGQVAWREELVVQPLEDAPDHDQPGDDQERTALADPHTASHLLGVVAQVAGPAPGARPTVGRDRTGAARPAVPVRPAPAHGQASSSPFERWATALSAAPVTEEMICSCVTVLTSNRPLLRPSRSTATRSATALMSPML